MHQNISSSKQDYCQVKVHIQNSFLDLWSGFCYSKASPKDIMKI